MICPPQISGGEIELPEMGRTCDTHIVEDRCMQGFGGET